MSHAKAQAVIEGRHTDWPVISWMVFVHLVALLGFFTFSWHNVLLMLFLNFCTGCVGITLTYHRLLTHRAYTVPKWFERILTTFGVLALQGGPGEWVAHHRMHHAGSDTPKDPHNAKEGFYYSHWGWLWFYEPRFDDPAILKRFARDIYADAYYRFLDKTWAQVLVQVAFGFFLLAVAGWPAVIWGVFVRLVVVYHSTWFVNSAAHIWGYTSYKVDDSAKNNWWVALLTWGEGWHNNHHAHADVAQAGHKWWEYDITYRIIQLFRLVGLAKNIKMLPEVTDIVTSRPIAVGEN